MMWELFEDFRIAFRLLYGSVRKNATKQEQNNQNLEMHCYGYNNDNKPSQQFIECQIQSQASINTSEPILQSQKLIKSQQLPVPKQNKTMKLIDHKSISATQKEAVYKKLKQSSLRSEIREGLRIPLRVQAYFWLYGFYGLYAIIKTIVMIPFDVVMGVINSLLSMLTTFRSRHSTLFSGLIIACFYVIEQPFRLFDVSYLYHAFRGQSTLKLYGLIFAFEIAQKILTMVTQHLLTRLQAELSVLGANIFDAIPQLCACVGLILLHTFSIYLQFNVFMVVLNSSMQNFVIFCFVINLTKMKSTAFKKFQLKNYSNQINYDAKDRLQKIIYIILFQLSQMQRTIPQIGLKLFLIFFLGSLIQHFKHATVLLLSGKQQQLKQLKRQLSVQIYHDKTTSTVAKCIRFDFTVIPFTVFTLKMASIILWANYDHSNNTILLCYLVLVGLALSIKLCLLFIRKLLPGIDFQFY